MGRLLVPKPESAWCERQAREGHIAEYRGIQGGEVPVLEDQAVLAAAIAEVDLEGIQTAPGDAGRAVP